MRRRLLATAALFVALMPFIGRGVALAADTSISATTFATGTSFCGSGNSPSFILHGTLRVTGTATLDTQCLIQMANGSELSFGGVTLTGSGALLTADGRGASVVVRNSTLNLAAAIDLIPGFSDFTSGPFNKDSVEIGHSVMRSGFVFVGGSCSGNNGSTLIRGSELSASVGDVDVVASSSFSTSCGGPKKGGDLEVEGSQLNAPNQMVAIDSDGRTDAQHNHFTASTIRIHGGIACHSDGNTPPVACL